MMSATRNTNGTFPFTSRQRQELEHQALVYKYIISGMPIPPHLLSSIETSLDPCTKLILHHQPLHQSIGWKCFQMGFARKIDPEPGRCRRTDGKKWRCSKEAYLDSKYCERHMHRGRNRSRKPVEVNLSTPNKPPLPISTKSPNYPSPNSLYSHLSSSTRPPGNVLSSQDQLLLESSPYSSCSGKDYRNSNGMKDEHPFFSGTMSASISWHLEPLAPSHPKRTLADNQNGYSHKTPRQQEERNQNHYHPLALKNNQHQKVMHRFFDERPHNDDHNKDSSTTQLSISIPTPARDLFLTHNDK